MWSTCLYVMLLATHAYVAPLQPHGRLTGAVVVGSASVDVSSYKVNDLLQQIKDLKEDKADLRSARASLEQAKDEVIALLKEEKTNLQKDLFQANIKAMAVTDTRFLLEVCSKSIYKGVSTTIATQELAKQVLDPQDLSAKKLTVKAQGWLKELTGATKLDKDLERNVCKLFSGLYTNLSLDHHHRKGVPTDDPGMYIGGKHLPVRLCVAILILEGQDNGVFDPEPIYFCDDSYNPQFELSRGHINEFKSKSS